MKRLLFILTACLCAGCGLFGSDDGGQCESGREGLFIKNGRDSYEVGEKAGVKVGNCTGSLIFIDGGSSADYDLEKNISGVWKDVDGRGGLYQSLQNIEAGEVRVVTLPVDPREDLIDAVAGTYRYELEIYNSTRDLLPEYSRKSNTFEITE